MHYLHLSLNQLFNSIIRAEKTTLPINDLQKSYQLFAVDKTP